MNKVCTKCGVSKPLFEFYSAGRKNPSKTRGSCITCCKKAWAKYRKANSKVINERTKPWNKAYRVGIRERFLEMYGWKCSCCGDPRHCFLTLDHIKPTGSWALGGRKHTNIEMLVAVKEHRPDLYQVLCMNCNFLKRRGDRCPCGTKYPVLVQN